MAKSPVNLQDMFLNHLRKERIPVVVYLVNGVRLTGTIKGFDNFVLLLRHEGQQMIYKHAISTIVPERAVEWMEEGTAGAIKGAPETISSEAPP